MKESLKFRLGRSPNARTNVPQPRLPAVGSKRCQGSAINVGAQVLASSRLEGDWIPVKLEQGGREDPRTGAPDPGPPAGRGLRMPEPSWDLANPAPLERAFGAHGEQVARGTEEAWAENSPAASRAALKLPPRAARPPARGSSRRPPPPSPPASLPPGPNPLHRPARPEDASRTHSRPGRSCARPSPVRSALCFSDLSPPPLAYPSPLPSLLLADPNQVRDRGGRSPSQCRAPCTRAPGSPSPAAPRRSRGLEMAQS